MRIMIKGGVWKNTEDEILKVAVMKYGKNQWARISSLLVRKSAKQCKARWYEWLDPSIKKTEWTREEDEKLLHLAKLMPTQWRTIAPIVGRTPAQCLERYEKLLDAACCKDESYEAGDDPRKLRPGEIDPNPESKPARPDPVDMDEDEKEMLSEARARLANTRGKKAKRKAREKQLEEARRLASLQKRRELKAAGIDVRKRRRKTRGIDYNAEIPFEKKPPPGFFEVSQEERPVQEPQFPTTIEELEGKRRVDVEAQLRKQDVARNKIAQRKDAPAAVMQVNKLNDPEAVRKRSKLMLPPPQISDRELEEIAKMGYASDVLSNDEELTEGSSITRALIANYNQTPARTGMTPLRTPQRTPGGKGDAIMLEAENLARLRETQTPLFGGENPELHPSDFSGVTPKKREIQTPNPIATPMGTPGGIGATPRVGMTPRDASNFSMTPKGTPVRDELHINEGLESPVSENAKAEKLRQAEMRRSLRNALGVLPAPKNEYQIFVPELPVEELEVVEEMEVEEDMSDILARKRAEEAAREAEILRKRSKVLQKGLPRPPPAAIEIIKNTLMYGEDGKGALVPVTYVEQADELIRKEMMLLLEYDNAKYPAEDSSVKAKKKGGKASSNGKQPFIIPEIEDIDAERLKEAADLVDEEVTILRMAMGHEDATIDDYAEARDACVDDMIYFPTRGSHGLSSVANTGDRLAALQYQFENVKKHMETETKKAVKLEQKLKILSQGYQMRAETLWRQIETIHKEADTLGTELECFRALHQQEQLTAPRRIESMQEAVREQMDRERVLQLRYENLLVEQENWKRLILEHDAAAAKIAAEKAAAEREAEEKAVAEREAKEKAVAAEREAEEKAAAEREAKEKAAAVAAEREAQEKSAAEREEKEKAAAAEREAEENAAAVREAEEKAAAEMEGKEKAAPEKEAEEKAAAASESEEKAAAEMEAKERATTNEEVTTMVVAESDEKEKAAAEEADTSAAAEKAATETVAQHAIAEEAERMEEEHADEEMAAANKVAEYAIAEQTERVQADEEMVVEHDVAEHAIDQATRMPVEPAAEVVVLRHELMATEKPVDEKTVSGGLAEAAETGGDFLREGTGQEVEAGSGPAKMELVEE
ncbi:hypothetical protein O6H91_Y188100 [Diphasiastrum complanatum]|nr:hypothetical protein O6H91_Y188100 [Diphasiastrum complanatum]